MPVAAPADRRFRRAQVKPARRRRSWTRWLRAARAVGALALFGVGAYQTALLVAEARALQVTRVVVRGNQRLSQAEVLGVLAGVRGQHILTADLEVWRSRVLASPWVASASLRRVLPSTIEVTVEEREPMGICRVRDVPYLVDAGGRIIDEYGPGYAQFDLPLIEGTTGSPARGEPALDEARAQLAGRLIASVHRNKPLFRRISQIDVRHADDAVVVLEDDPALIHLGDDQFLERLQSYVELAPAIYARVAPIEYVDMRFEGKVYVRPAQGSGTAGTTGAASRR